MKPGDDRAKSDKGENVTSMVFACMNLPNTTCTTNIC